MTTTTKKSELSFIERVAIRLKGGDEARRLKFYLKTVEHLKEQKDICYTDKNEGIKKLQARIEEAQESLIEVVETIDDDRIKTADAIDDYIIVYEQKVNRAIQKVEDLIKQKEAQEKQVARIEKILEVLG